jgi:hypothetical protein
MAVFMSTFKCLETEFSLSSKFHDSFSVALPCERRVSEPLKLNHTLVVMKTVRCYKVVRKNSSVYYGKAIFIYGCALISWVRTIEKYIFHTSIHGKLLLIGCLPTLRESAIDYFSCCNKISETG